MILSTGNGAIDTDCHRFRLTLYQVESLQILHGNNHLHSNADVQLPRRWYDLTSSSDSKPYAKDRTGPTIAIAQTAIDFFPMQPINLAIGKVAYFFTTTALAQGLSNFVWVPLTNKFGRRPIYITSYTIYFACCIWLIFEKSYGGFLAGRILIGVGAGAAETIAPVSIADVFFLHERGFVMS